MAKEIRERGNMNEKVVEGLEELIPQIQSVWGKRILSVSWLARVDLYGDGDFGWGKPKKQKILSIDGEKYAMSLCRSKEFDGGLEIGLSLPELTMNAFTAAFSVGLVRRKNLLI